MHISLGVQRLTIVHWSRKYPDILTQDQAKIPAILSGRVELKDTALGKHVSNSNTEGTQTPEPAGCGCPEVQRGSIDAVPGNCLQGTVITVLISPICFFEAGLALPSVGLQAVEDHNVIYIVPCDWGW